MIRYLISLIIFFIGIFLTISLAGNSGWDFIDIPNFILVGIFPFIFTSTLFGFKEMCSAFLITFNKETEKNKLLRALKFFNIYGKATLVTGFIVMLIGIVTMLQYLEDPTAIGPNLALAILSLFYSGIIYLLLIIPFTILLNKKIKE